MIPEPQEVARGFRASRRNEGGGIRGLRCGRATGTQRKILGRKRRKLLQNLRRPLRRIDSDAKPPTPIGARPWHAERAPVGFST